MSTKEKSDPQFNDEISFARYIIRNANNFVLLPLDSNTVAQLNDNMRSYCISASTFINSIKHILAEHNSPKSFGPISGEEFKNILQLDNTAATTTTTKTTTMTTNSNNIKFMKPEIETKKRSDFKNDNSSKNNLVVKKITKSTKIATVIKPDNLNPDNNSDNIPNKTTEKPSSINKTAIQLEPISTYTLSQVTENNTDSQPIDDTTSFTFGNPTSITTSIHETIQETKKNKNTFTEIDNDNGLKKINDIMQNESIRENESKSDLLAWANLRESMIKSNHITDFSTLNTDAVLKEWLRETLLELKQLKKELNEYPLETWNINFLEFLQKHHFTILTHKHNKVTGSTPFHDLENKFICNYVLALLFPKYLDAKDPDSSVYYKNIKKKILGADSYAKLHQLRTPPLEDLTSEKKIKLWLEKLRPAFSLLTNILHFDPVRAVSYCISHYSNGEYSKTLTMWKTRPSLNTALSIGAAIFSKLLKVQRSKQNNEKDFSLACNNAMVSDARRRGSLEENRNKKRPFESTDIELRNMKRPTLEKQLDSEFTKKKRSTSTIKKLIDPILDKNRVKQFWFNMHANQEVLVRTLNFSTFNKKEVEKHWIKTLIPRILPLINKLVDVKNGESFLKWAYQFIKLLESEHFSTLLKYDINKMSHHDITPLHEAEDSFLFKHVLKIAYPDYNLPESASAYNYWEAIKSKMCPYYAKLPQFFKKKFQSITVDILKSKVQLKKWIESLDEYHCAVYNSTIHRKQQILTNEFIKYCPPQYYNEINSWKSKPYVYVINKIVDIMNRNNILVDASKTAQLPTSTNSIMANKKSPIDKTIKAISINASKTTINENTKNEISTNDTKKLVTEKTLVVTTNNFNVDKISSKEFNRKQNPNMSNNNQNVPGSNTNTTTTTETNPRIDFFTKLNNKITNDSINANRKIQIKGDMKNPSLASNTLTINKNDSSSNINTSILKIQVPTTTKPVIVQTSGETSKDSTMCDISSEKKINKKEPTAISSTKSPQLSQSSIENVKKTNESPSIKTQIPEQQGISVTTSTNKTTDTTKYTKQQTNNSISTNHMNSFASKNTAYDTSTSNKANTTANIESSTISSQVNVSISTNKTTTIKAQINVDHLKSLEKSNTISTTNMITKTPISNTTSLLSIDNEQKPMSNKQNAITALPLSPQPKSEMNAKREAIKTPLEIIKNNSKIGVSTTTASSPQINSTQAVSNGPGFLPQKCVSANKKSFTTSNIASVTDHKAQRTYNLPLAPRTPNNNNLPPTSSASTSLVSSSRLTVVNSSPSTSGNQNIPPKERLTIKNKSKCF